MILNFKISKIPNSFKIFLSIFQFIFDIGSNEIHFINKIHYLLINVIIKNFISFLMEYMYGTFSMHGICKHVNIPSSSIETKYG